MKPEFLIFVVIFFTFLMFAWGFVLLLHSQRQRRDVAERIKRIGQEGLEGPSRAEAFNGLKSRWITFFESLGTRVKPKKEDSLSRTRKRLIKAGYRKDKASLLFFGMKVFLAALFLVVFLMLKLWVFKTMTSVNFMFFSAVVAMIGYYLPDLWIRNRTAQRRQKMQEGLPEALDLMVVCVESGNGLDAAINRVGEEMKLSNPVLSEEFRLLSFEMRVGKRRQDALRSLCERTDLDELNSLVTLLVQTEKFGTSIGQALRVHSDSMRVKRYQKAEEIAQKMPVKLIFPLFFFIFPAILLVVLGPALIGIIRTLNQMGSR